jgi:xylan 1,4-beta-xylosidase
VDRRFRNPILPGFHPDPSICRVGRDFYLVTSSFEYFPGLPIHHSRDLVHWRPIGHALTRVSQLDLDGAGSSRGIFAPTIRHHRGRFYLVVTLVDRGGNFMVTARRPEGPWSEPIWIDRDGIDPSLTFLAPSRGGAGRVLYTRNGKGTDLDHPFVYQGELDPRTGKRGRLRVIWRGLGGIWPEAPHVYFLRGCYYLFAAEGGTAWDHCEMVGRAAEPYGPFAPSPRNPILGHRARRGHPIQATGHVDLVTLDDGTTWAVFLGIRPRRGHNHLGRETFLAPVTFDADGWPMIGAGGRVELSMRGPALPPHRWPRPARDEFAGPSLGPEWMYLRAPPGRAVSLAERPGHLRLWGQASTLDDVAATTFVGRRQRDFAVRCRVTLDFAPRRPGEAAGLTVRAREEFHLDVEVRLGRGGREVVAVRRAGGPPRVLGRAPLSDGAVELEIDATAERYRLGARVGRRWVTLGEVAARALSAEAMSRRGIMHFTGAVLGLYATGKGNPATTPADFRSFHYVIRGSGVNFAVSQQGGPP